MSNFRVGQRVVCVDVQGRYGKVLYLKKGEIYTIKAINICGCGSIQLVLKEITADANNQYCSNCFTKNSIRSYLSERFRPIDETLAEETEAMVQKFATGIEEYLEIIKETETIKIK